MNAEKSGAKGPEYTYPAPAAEKSKRKAPLLLLVLLVAALAVAGWYFSQNRQPVEDMNKPDLKGPRPGNFPGRPAPRVA